MPLYPLDTVEVTMACANENLSRFLQYQGISGSRPKFVSVYDAWTMPRMASQNATIHFLDEVWQLLYTLECYELTIDALRQLKTRRVRYIVVISNTGHITAFYPKGLKCFSIAMVTRLWGRQQQRVVQ